jgi:hypothetical protein
VLPFHRLASILLFMTPVPFHKFLRYVVTSHCLHRCGRVSPIWRLCSGSAPLVAGVTNLMFSGVFILLSFPYEASSPCTV